MNNLITELISQCAYTVTDYSMGIDSSHEEFDKEKFAQLIVQECLDVITKNNPRPPGSTILYSNSQDQYFDTGWQVSAETKAHQIKKRFEIQ